MALADSLLSAIVRADGDALVMHVGERPYVVVGTSTINISTHGLNLEAMTGMLAQLLPADAHLQLEEFGAVEHRIPQHGDDRFTVVAARGGDDIWIEIRRRRARRVAEPEPVASPASEVDAQPAYAPLVIVPAPEPIVESLPEPVPELAPEPSLQPTSEFTSEPVSELSSEFTPERGAEPASEPMSEFTPEPVSELFSEPSAEHVPELTSELFSEPVPNLTPQMTSEPVPELTSEPVSEPTPEPNSEPVGEPVSELSSEPAPEPMSEPIPEPVPEPVAEPVSEPAREPVAEPIAARFVDPVAPSVPDPSFEIAASAEPPSVAPTRFEVPMPIAASIAASTDTQSMPGVVLPMTRTVRIEVPPRTATASRAAGTNIERLLRIASARGAGALFLTSDSRPWIRVEGDLRQLDSEAPLSRTDVEGAIMEIAPESGHESIGKGVATEWIAEFADVGRVRCTTFADHRGPGVLLRMIATRTATAEQLGLAREIEALATESQGLVLVTGPRASGKSTLMSALVDLVNRQRAEFVITLERQIRLVHENKAALVSQREIRGSADDTLAAARSALRENPDVIVVDDLISPHMVPLLLTAASEGQLVFVAMTAPSTADAVQRFIELAPTEMRKAVQAAMAESFRGAVAQVLLKKVGGGSVAAREVLLEAAPVTRVIHEGQLDQLSLALEGGRKHGMVSFTDALVDFVRAGSVDLREAFRKAPDRERLLESLKRNGLDTTVVERLA